LTRHFGYFIKNVLKPIILELDKALQECRILEIRGEVIEKWFESAIGCWFAIELFRGIIFLIATGMFCAVVLAILK